MIGLIYIRWDRGVWDGEEHPALVRLGGLPLLERQIRTLQFCGCRRVVVAAADEEREVREYLGSRSGFGLEVELLAVTPPSASLVDVLKRVRDRCHSPVLLLMGDVVCSVEFLGGLLEGRSGAFVTLPSGDSPTLAAALLDTQELARIESGAAQGADRDDLVTLFRDSSLREIQATTVAARTGKTGPGNSCFRVRILADLEDGLRSLIESTQKGGGDFVGEAIHPRLENWLVRHLVDTPVTPNQVTFLNLAIGLAAAGLFVGGWFQAGVLLTLPVGVLDGVDGKLARLRMSSSRLGAFLDGIVVDKVLQTLWVVAIAARQFGQIGRVAALPLAVAFFCADNLTRVLSTWYKNRFREEQLDRLPRFRRIRAGRNVYVVLLAVAGLLDSPMAALWGIAAWSGISFAVRAGHALKQWRQARALQSSNDRLKLRVAQEEARG